jgi:hypothetical protein
VDGVEVVPVPHVLHVPAVRREAHPHVLAEGEGGVAVDGDVVVVVDHAEPAQAQVAGKARGLAGHAFHQVAVAAEAPDRVVHDLEARPVEALRQHPLGARHADGVAEALAQGTGGGLDTGGVAALGVAGRLRVPLAEVADLVERQVVARQVQQRVEQHRCVAAREHEPVAILPARVPRTVAEEAVPEEVRGRRQRHGRAGMSRIGGLDGVHRKAANGIDAAPGEIVREAGGVLLRGAGSRRAGQTDSLWAYCPPAVTAGRSGNLARNAVRRNRPPTVTTPR